VELVLGDRLLGALLGGAASASSAESSPSASASRRAAVSELEIRLELEVGAQGAVEALGQRARRGHVVEDDHRPGRRSARAGPPPKRSQ